MLTNACWQMPVHFLLICMLVGVRVSHSMMSVPDSGPCDIVWLLQISKRTKLATPKRACLITALQEVFGSYWHLLSEHHCCMFVCEFNLAAIWLRRGQFLYSRRWRLLREIHWTWQFWLGSCCIVEVSPGRCQKIQAQSIHSRHSEHICYADGVQEGYSACRSHIASNAIKTSAPMCCCVEITRSLMQ